MQTNEDQAYENSELYTTTMDITMMQTSAENMRGISQMLNHERISTNLEKV